MNVKNFVIIIGLVGIIFLIGGVGATINRTMSTVACEACGMEIEKTDTSTFLVISSDGTDHYACCPICGMVVAEYYGDSKIQSQCFSCEKQIGINFNEGEISSVSFSGNSEFIRVVLGGSCMTNKIACSTSCSSTIARTYDWASDAPQKTLQESANIAEMKLSSFTVAYRPTKIPLLNYALIGIGISLLLISSVLYVSEKRKNNKI